MQVSCSIFLCSLLAAVVTGSAAPRGRCTDRAAASRIGTSLLSTRVTRSRVGQFSEAQNSSKVLYHQNLTEHYERQVEAQDSKCENCSAAEEALVVALRAAHSAHSVAQDLATDLVSAQRAHEAAADSLQEELATFMLKRGDLDPSVLAPSSPGETFEGYLNKVRQLQQSAESIARLQATEKAKQDAMDSIQTAFDQTATTARTADGAVEDAQEAADADCGHLVGRQPPTPAPAQPSEGPIQLSERTKGHDEAVVNGNRFTMIRGRGDASVRGGAGTELCAAGEECGSFKVTLKSGAFQWIGVASGDCCIGSGPKAGTSGSPWSALYLVTEGWTSSYRGAGNIVGSPSIYTWWNANWDYFRGKTIVATVNCKKHTFQLAIEGGDDFLGEMTFPEHWESVYPFFGTHTNSFDTDAELSWSAVDSAKCLA